MQEYQIWSEGYRCTGNVGTAHFHGTSQGSTFKEALGNFAKNNSEFSVYFNDELLTYWGCRLFETKIQAQETFN